MPGEFGYPFIQAHYYDSRRTRNPLWIVIHCTGVHEHPDYAEDLGRFFARERFDNQQVSSHFGCDSNSTVQYVRCKDVAFCARATGNEHGLHVELSGRAEQTRAQWQDVFGQGLMAQAAKLCDVLATKYSIPLRFLTDDELRGKRVKGFTTHAQITRVFGGTHTDPGAGFPASELLRRIRELREDEDMALSDEDIKRIHDFRVHKDWLSTGVAADQVYRYFTTNGELREVMKATNEKLDRVIELLTPKEPE